MDTNASPSANKLIIVAAPSGAGKTTIVRHLLSCFPNKLAFSISATNRKARHCELEGKDYYFLSTAEFKDKIRSQAFVEWEEVYENAFYGTLKAEVDRIWQMGQHVIFDVDVKGALNIKHQYEHKALSIFIDPPNIKALRSRLQIRQTETETSINKRLQKAAYEMQFKNQFDAIVLNDELEEAKAKAYKLVNDFIGT